MPEDLFNKLPKGKFKLEEIYSRKIESSLACSELLKEKYSSDKKLRHSPHFATLRALVELNESILKKQREIDEKLNVIMQNQKVMRND